jgi:hypothetical protein
LFPGITDNAKARGARVSAALRRLFADPSHGQAIRDDLRCGLSALPIWMQEFVRSLLGSTIADVPTA